MQVFRKNVEVLRKFLKILGEYHICGNVSFSIFIKSCVKFSLMGLGQSSIKKKTTNPKGCWWNSLWRQKIEKSVYACRYMHFPNVWMKMSTFRLFKLLFVLYFIHSISHSDKLYNICIPNKKISMKLYYVYVYSHGEKSKNN